MAAGWPFLQLVANTPWLLALLLPFMSAITYDRYWRAARVLPIVVEGVVRCRLAGMDVEVKFRPLGNGKGCMFVITAQAHPSNYKWGLGIA